MKHRTGKEIYFGFKDMYSKYDRENKNIKTTGKIRISDKKGNEIGQHKVTIETKVHQIFDKNHKPKHGFGSIDVFDFHGTGVEIYFTPKVNIHSNYSHNTKEMYEQAAAKYIKNQYHNRITREDKLRLLVN